MLPLVTLPTKTLHEPSEKISKVLLKSAEIQRFIADMVPAMYEHEGIGLAAPQVGKNIQACIIGKEALPKEFTKDLPLINPEFYKLSKKKEIDTEGCLSVPGTFGKVTRYKDIMVTALNERGEKIEFEAHGFFARVIQHEVDHLNGMLFVDKATDLYQVEKEQREAYLEKMRKERAEK